MPRITVAAGKHDRLFVPVSAEVAAGAGGVRLVDQESQREVPFQASADGKRIAWIVDNLAAGQTRAYELGPGAAAALGGGVALQQVDGSRVEVRIGGEFFTAYHFGSDWSRPFLYPVIGPYGASVTRHYPMKEVEGERTDHPHHRSIFSAFGDVNGVNDWADVRDYGRIVTNTFRALEQGPVYGAIRVNSSWESHSGEKLLGETRDIVIYNVPSAGRVVDYDLVLTAVNGDVTFGDTKEGGILGVRVASSMDAARGGRIENSYGGVDEKETWGKRAEWCDYSGPVEGKWIGITVMDHPLSFRYPTYWHVRDYGLMTTNMFGLSAFYSDPSRRGEHTLKNGESLSFRYRIYIHRGDAAEGGVGAKYHDFISPPVVTVA
ncbi:MAG: PmoA family protein [Armatimonadetes bacterium]|nr:PmoA family protein [Armatimonadota bacterium]